MFHLEFQNNHQQPDEPRDMFNKMSKSYEESAAQETEKSYVPKVQTKKGMHSEESEPCNSQTLPENKTHETNNDKLHRTSSCVSKEGHKDLSENSLDDTETTQTKSLEPNKTGLQDEVPKSNKDMSGQHDDISGSSVKERKETNGYDPFIYKNNEKKLIFKRTSYDYKLICPNCLKETKQMIQHICKGNCKIVVNMEDFKTQLKNYKKSYTKENQCRRKKECIERQRVLDESKVKEKQNKCNKEYMERQRALDEIKAKEDQNKRKKESRDNQRAENESKVKETQNKHNKEYMERQGKLSE